jgi:drug/metabolite transporter (DMT)-like permease
MLPLTIFVTIMGTGPFFAALLTTIFLGEKITYFQLFCMAGSFSGVLIIAKGIPKPED